MPTIEGKVVRLACNTSSDDGVLDKWSGEKIVLWQGATAQIQCGLFNDGPSADSLVTDFSEFVSATLLVRKNSPRGTLLLSKYTEGFDDSVNYASWLDDTKEHFTFSLSAVETNQVVAASGNLPIYFSITIATTSSAYLAAFGYGQIQDVGIVDIGDPTDPTYLNVSVDENGDVYPAVTYNFISPSFSGAPTAPLAPFGANTAQLATTAFVQAALALPSWTAPSLLNSWANLGSVYQVAGYVKGASGFVRLRGLITGGMTTSGTTLFVLPSGYRPLKTEYFTSANSTAVCSILVDSSGNVKLADNSGASISLSGICFATN